MVPDDKSAKKLVCRLSPRDHARRALIPVEISAPRAHRCSITGRPPANVIELVSPPASLTVSVTCQVPAAAHVFRAVGSVFVSSDRPFPQSQIQFTIP